MRRMDEAGERSRRNVVAYLNIGLVPKAPDADHGVVIAIAKEEVPVMRTLTILTVAASVEGA